MSTTKYFGNISIDGIKEAKEKKAELFTQDEKYGNQLKVTAMMFDDGGISISIWDNDTKERINLGNLRVSKFNDEEVTKAEEANLPF